MLKNINLVALFLIHSPNCWIFLWIIWNYHSSCLSLRIQIEHGHYLLYRILESLGYKWHLCIYKECVYDYNLNCMHTIWSSIFQETVKKLIAPTVVINQLTDNGWHAPTTWEVGIFFLHTQMALSQKKTCQTTSITAGVMGDWLNTMQLSMLDSQYKIIPMMPINGFQGHRIINFRFIEQENRKLMPKVTRQ